MKPLYVAIDSGVRWSIYEQDASISLRNPILHNLTEWQAKAIAAILNQG